jgi:hypothetical protein
MVDGEDSSFWTFEQLQERWVETVQQWDRMPDRERGWLKVRAHWPEIKRHGFFGDGGGELNHADEEAEPKPQPLTRSEVAAMAEAAEWLLLVPEDDRRLVAAALRYLAHDHDRVPWTKLRRRLGEKRTTGALRMRYERAVAVATLRLNGMPEAQALATARRSPGGWDYDQPENGGNPR